MGIEKRVEEKDFFWEVEWVMEVFIEVGNKDIGIWGRSGENIIRVMLNLKF